MKERVMEILCCPLCRSTLELSNTRRWKGDIRSGRMVCTDCSQTYPVAVGRPVLLTAGMVDSWRAPIDEVLGIESAPCPPLSIPRLVEMGLEAALRRADDIDSIDEDLKADGECKVEQSVKGKIRYRGSGKWFDAGSRRQRLLNFGGGLPNAFEEFMNAVEETGPEVLLDIASGGGFGVSHQVYRNRSVKQVIAVERDLKCLGNIQYRFESAGGGDGAEAVGGDVRVLPLLSESVDTVMMLQAVHEMSGISRMLREVHRLLKPGGHFVLEVSEKPFTDGLIGLEEYIIFAEATDLYAGYEDLQNKGEKTGFDTVLSEGFTRDGKGNLRLISMRKR